MAVTKLTLKTWHDRSAHEKAQLGEPPSMLNLCSAMERRLPSRQSSLTITTPAYDAFAVDDGHSTDFQTLYNISMNGYAVMTGMDSEFNADAFDWVFWDQMMKHPDLFLPGAS